MHWKIDTAWISYEKWYKNYKTGVSTDRDSEVGDKGRTSEEWLYQPEIDKQEQERHPFVDKTSHAGKLGNSSELKARADAFWNVLKRQLLISANAQ